MAQPRLGCLPPDVRSLRHTCASDKAVLLTLRPGNDLAVHLCYMMPMSGQASGGEGRSWSQSRDQDEPQGNREAEGLHEPSVLGAPPLSISLTILHTQNIFQTENKTKIAFQSIQSSFPYRWRFGHHFQLSRAARWSERRCIAPRSLCAHRIWQWSRGIKRRRSARLVCRRSGQACRLRRLYCDRLDLRVHKRATEETITLLQWTRPVGTCSSTS